jgi:uncharacterized membrane protein
MTRRPLAGSQLAWLRDQLDLWREHDLVSPEQAKGILDLYETPQQTAARQAARGVFVLLAVAGLFFALAVLLLIGFNWEALPAFVKLTLIVSAVLGTHATALTLRERWGWPRAAELVFFFGCLLYGAGLFLIGQVFQINAHWPDGLWWWALGVLPFALALETALPHALLAVLLATWAGVEVIGFGLDASPRWWWLWPGGKALSLPLLVAPGLVRAYRTRSAAVLALYVPVCVWWLVLETIVWRVDANPAYLLGAAGAVLLLLAQAWAEDRRFAAVYRTWGVLLVGGVLAVLSYYDFNRWSAQDFGRGTGFGPETLSGWLQPIVIGVLVASGVAFARRRHGDVPEAPRELLHRQWLPAALAAFMAVLSLMAAARAGPDVEASAVSLAVLVFLPTVAANVAMVALGVWLIGVGLREDRGLPFAAGVGYLLLWAWLRYIDLFSSFGGMLGAALMFFLCGAVLTAVALYWRRRREVLHG